MKQKELTPISKPCIERAIAPPNELTPARIQQMRDCIRSTASTVRANTPIVASTSGTRFRAGIVRNNLQIFQTVENYFEHNNNMLCAGVDLNAWTEAMNILEMLSPAIDELRKTLTSATGLELAVGNTVFENFARAYHHIKIMAADGIPDAVAVWPVMKQIWDHLRGRRGPMCPVKELNHALMKANEVYEMYKDKSLDEIHIESLDKH